MTEPEKITTRGYKFTCLIVEDDSAFGAVAAQVVRDQGGEAGLAATVAAAREAVAGSNFDLVLLDNHLPDGRGSDFFEQFFRRNPDTPVIMITGVPDLRDAVALTRNGLFDYLTKPVEVQALVSALQRARQRMVSREKASKEAEWFGESPAMKEVIQQLRQAARHPATTVLLTGETGTGKDLAARLLHRLTYSADTAPFVAVNCAAMPAEMFESELFGAERGAYTGAEKRRAGLVGAAARGTLFLDEIAEVPLPLQAKLLRLLEAREYRILGSTENQGFTGRFVAATNKSLADEVKAGRFRDDLRYRLDVFTVEMPALRRHRTDVAGLAELLLAQLARKYDRATPLLKPDDLSSLAAHDFPGNVRELRNVLERSLLKTPEESRWLATDLNWIQRESAAVPAPEAAPAANSSPIERNLSPLEEQEYRLIRRTLGETQGGIRRAAAKLGMSPQALLRRLEKWPELREAKKA
jgi:two-component system response regulator AtoC